MKELPQCVVVDDEPFAKKHLLLTIKRQAVEDFLDQKIGDETRSILRFREGSLWERSLNEGFAAGAAKLLASVFKALEGGQSPLNDLGFFTAVLDLAEAGKFPAALTLLLLFRDLERPLFDRKIIPALFIFLSALQLFSAALFFLLFGQLWLFGSSSLGLFAPSSKAVLLVLVELVFKCFLGLENLSKVLSERRVILG